MEKQNNALDAELSWLAHWSEYLSQAPFYAGEGDSAEIRQLLQALIEESLQGNSGLLISTAKIKTLAPYILNEAQAIHHAAPMVHDGNFLALYRYWSFEQRLAQEIVRLSQQVIHVIDVHDYQTLLIDPQQQAALTQVASKALSLITGGPGTGKTYTLARVIAVLNACLPDIRIALVAPTGKAAQRMQEALHLSFNDPKLMASGLIDDGLKQQQTQTLHRLLGIGHRQTARFNKKQPLPYDVIVVDEASMLDLKLATLLFEAVPLNCRLILLGDSKQLASVDVGAVLADFQQCPELADSRVHLVASRRFAHDAKIGAFAQFIQSVNPDQSSTSILQQIEHRIASPSQLQSINLECLEQQDMIQIEYLPESSPLMIIEEYYERLMIGFMPFVMQLKKYQHSDNSASDIQGVIDAFDQYRILVAIRFGDFGLERINRYAEQWLTQHLSTLAVGGWYIGRPVMMVYNDYQLGISNGDIGLCFRHRTEPTLFEVYFPSLNKWIATHRLPQTIQTAFALTIHKSQGSEFQHVAVAFDALAQKVLSQELLYTAITRAKKVVSLLVDQQAFVQSLQVQTTRKSGLVTKINKKFKILN